MSEEISRRDFLKFTAVGAAAAAVLTGCGPASRYVVRRSYTDMPEYNQNGISTYFATTCRECPSGCGLIMRTKEGRAIKAEGNPKHPVNQGKLCSRGLTAVQGLYNPDRLQGPVKRSKRGDSSTETMSWDNAVEIIKTAFKQNNSDEIAFLLGSAPDHLFDLVTELTAAANMPAPVRYNAYTMFEGKATLLEAANAVFGSSTLPFFDLGQAEVIFSFGANFLETWLSPVSYARGYAQMRKGAYGKRGHLVVFEPRQSMTAGNADEWVAITPGSEGIIAAAIGKRVAEIRGVSAGAFATIDLASAAKFSGVPLERIEALAAEFAHSAAPVALPGGGAISHAQGLAASQTVLALNGLVDNLGKAGGLFLIPDFAAASSFEEVESLIAKMKSGKVKTLLIHGVNPLFELPESASFMDAMSNVPQVISFASYPDETALYSDYVFPDHTPLESWGYQRMLAGSEQNISSAAQPVVVPLYETKATVDVLLAASAGILSYYDEVDFLQKKLLPLLNRLDGNFTALEILTFWTQWLQNGGWWTGQSSLEKPASFNIPELIFKNNTAPQQQFYFLTYPTQMGDGSGANRPWLQETPDPMTTVMWNSWVEIHPDTAHQLGVRDDDIVTITSSTGSIEAAVYLYPAIRPDTVAIPFGQGHTALGRYAEGRGSNPAKILSLVKNEAGDIAYGDTLVTIAPTGKRRPVARFESRVGVYGDGNH